MKNKKQDYVGEHILLPLIVGTIMLLLCNLFYMFYLFSFIDSSILHFGDTDIINYRGAHFQSAKAFNIYLITNIIFSFAFLLGGSYSIYRKKRWIYFTYLMLLIVLSVYIFFDNSNPLPN